MSILKTIKPLSIIFLASIIVISIGCESANKEDVKTSNGIITGTFTGVNQGSVVMLRSYNRGVLVQVGRTTTEADGSFEIMPNQPLKMGFHQIMINKKNPIIIITDSTETVNISAHVPEVNGYLTGATITGSKSSALLSDFKDVIIPLQDSLSEIQTLYLSTTGDNKLGYEALLISLINDINSAGLEFINSNSSDLSS